MIPIPRVVMQTVPLIGFVTATVLIKKLAARKNKIKKIFEVKPLTETRVEESNQAELISRRGMRSKNNLLLLRSVDFSTSLCMRLIVFLF